MVLAVVFFAAPPFDPLSLGKLSTKAIVAETTTTTAKMNVLVGHQQHVRIGSSFFRWPITMAAATIVAWIINWSNASDPNSSLSSLKKDKQQH